MTTKQKPDLLFVTLVHQALRVDAHRMVAAASGLQAGDTQRIASLKSFFDVYREQLCLHHAHEDDIFFPTLHAIAGESAAPIAELAAQHAVLDSDLEAIGDGLSSLGASGNFASERADVVGGTTRMAEHLEIHLTMEEDTVLPLMASAVPQATYKQLEAQARKRTPRRQARFLIPWIVGHATSDQRRELFKMAPPLRAIYLVNRHRCRRFDRLCA